MADDPNYLRRKLRDNRDPVTQKRYLHRLDDRIEELLRKAFCQAGVELARQYEVSANLKKFPASGRRDRLVQRATLPADEAGGFFCCREVVVECRWTFGYAGQSLMVLLYSIGVDELIVAERDWLHQRAEEAMGQ